MFKKVYFYLGALVLSSLFLTACQNGTSSTTPTPTTTTGTLIIGSLNDFPASTTAQTITVTLENDPPANGGALGFSDITFHATESNASTLFTVNPDPAVSTCLAITPSSTATTCTFSVYNTSGSSGDASTLNQSGYYVTGEFNGQTITSNTSTPPTLGVYWQITINNSGSVNQYLFIFGQEPGTNTHGVVVFNDPTGTTHTGAFHTYSASTPYGSNEDSIILQPGTNIIYVPYGIAGGRAYISASQMSGLELTSNGGIVTPVSGDSSDPNYNTVYDDFEFTYDTTGSNTAAVVNQTAVDFLSTPICLQGSTAYQPVQQSGYCNVSRSDLLSEVYAELTATNVPSEWAGLRLMDGSTVLRILNPGNPNAVSAFDAYFNDYTAALAGEYSAADSLVVENNGETLSGEITGTSGNYSYTFTCTAGACGSDDTPMPLTAANLLNGAAPSADNNQVTAYQMISSAFMAGQLPPTVSPGGPITEAFLQTQSASFYTQPTTSPTLPANSYQYSVFSSALNTVGNNHSDPNIYTWPYDDVLGKSSTMTDSLSGPTVEPADLTVTVNPN